MRIHIPRTFKRVDASFKGKPKVIPPSPKEVHMIKNPKGKIHPGETEAKLHMCEKEALRIMADLESTVQIDSHQPHLST